MASDGNECAGRAFRCQALAKEIAAELRAKYDLKAALPVNVCLLRSSIMIRAVDSLDTTERTAMRRALHQVLSTLATSGARRQIGVCQDCTHFGREMCGNLPSTSPSAAECLFLGVSDSARGRRSSVRPFFNQ